MKRIAFVAVTAALVLSACQQEAKVDPAAETSAAPETKPGLVLSGGVLVLPAVAGNPGAAYFTFVNTGDKPVTLAAASIAGAGKSEMHQTMGGAMAAHGMIEVKPGETVKFERGGSHVMAFDLAATVTAGSTAELTLTFADGDKLSAPLKVESVTGAAN